MKYAYYPGCTSGTTSSEYDESVRDISATLGIEYREVPDWTCCGASSCHIIDHELAIALPGRNLALAEKSIGLPVVAPCPACSLRLKTAEFELGKDSSFKAKIEQDIGMKLDLSHKSRHILEVLYTDLGIDAIKEKVTRPLEGLKVVTYYGCYLVRPPEVTTFDDHENPVVMDEIMKAAGAEVVDWSYKVDCCGGSLSIAAPDIVQKLSGKIVDGAREVEADIIVCACGICQLNLDMRQPRGEETAAIPAVYFSELLSVAFGNDRIRQWAGKHFVDPLPALNRLGLLS